MRRRLDHPIRPVVARSILLGQTRELLQRNRVGIGVFFLFLVLTLVITYPLVFHLSSHIAGCCDAWQGYWYIWWTKKALSFGTGSHPFFTEHMYYPTGTNLSFESMYNRLLGSLLWPILGGLAAYNLLFMSTFVLSAFGTYLLVSYLTGDRMAGVVSGVIFSFSAVHTQSMQSLSVSTIQWLPFFALWLLKLLDAPTVKNALLCAVLFLLVVLSSGYYALAALLLLVLYLLWEVRRVLTKRALKVLFVFTATSIVLVLPFVLLHLKDAVLGQAYVKVSEVSRFFSTDILSLVTPPLSNPIYKGYVSDIYPRFLTHFTEWESYLGVLPIMLALVGVCTGKSPQPPFGKEGRGRIFFWLLALAVFTAISLGPHPQVLGREFEGVKLPFYFLQDLPAFESMRIPKRFLIITMLSLAVLSGYGTHYLLSRQPGIGRVAAYSALSLILVALLFDYWGWPRSFVTEEASVPRFYKEMKADKGNESVRGGQGKERVEQHNPVILHIPLLSLHNPKPMYFQTVHDARLVGGYVEEARLSPEAAAFISNNRFLTSILLPGVESKAAITPQEALDGRKLFETLPEIEYVVLMKRHRFYPQLKSFTLYSPWLESLFGMPIYEDKDIAAYRVSDSGLPDS